MWRSEGRANLNLLVSRLSSFLSIKVKLYLALGSARVTGASPLALRLSFTMAKMTTAMVPRIKSVTIILGFVAVFEIFSTLLSFGSLC